jgi:hypothetical protein
MKDANLVEQMALMLVVTKEMNWVGMMAEEKVAWTERLLVVSSVASKVVK